MDTTATTAIFNVLAYAEGKHVIPSNFYAHDIHYNDMKFNCVEQAFQHAKAVMYERMDIATRLIHLKTGSEQRRCGKVVLVDDRWIDERVNIMREILRCKLHNVPQYGEWLAKTTEMIVEAVPYDQFWSSGLSKQEAIKSDPSTYPGKNVMGQLHIEMRNLLKQHQRQNADYMLIADLMCEHSVLEMVWTEEKDDGTYKTVIAGNDKHMIHEVVRDKLAEEYSVVTEGYLPMLLQMKSNQ